MINRIDCMENNWARKFITRYRKPRTADDHRQKLNKLFQYIYEVLGLLPSEVNFLKFTKITVGDTLIAVVPIQTSFLANFLGYIYQKSSAPNSYYKLNSTLRTFFKYWCDRDYSFQNPMIGISAPRLPKKLLEERALSISEANRLLIAASKIGLPCFCLIETLLRSGIRPEELCTLTKNDLDFNLGIIYVNGKSGFRIRPMHTILQNTLKAYLASDYYNEMVSKSDKEYVFFSGENDSKQLTNDSVNSIIKSVAQEAGLDKNITAYWFRRSFAQFIYKGGADLSELQRIMDHDVINNTRSYVAGLVSNEVADLVDNSPLAKLAIRIHHNLIKELTNQINHP